VKRCPTCNKTFTDEHLSFCVDDGTPLVTVEPVDDEATVVRPSAESSVAASSPRRADSAYQPPAYVPPGSSAPGKRNTWPLLLGTLVIVVLLIGGLGIAAAVLIPRMLSGRSNTNSTNANANLDRRNLGNENSNFRNSNSTNSNEHGNSNAIVAANAPPPTDREAVLGDLKNLEDEWTVANINADKKKLNTILADDYVGITEGRAQGKAEYLKTIERDTAIQHWQFEDLRVTLNGDRASLYGIIRLDVKDQNGQDAQLAFQFTD
jgi:hypothetical protein